MKDGEPCDILLGCIGRGKSKQTTGEVGDYWESLKISYLPTHLTGRTLFLTVAKTHTIYLQNVIIALLRYFSPNHFYK